MKALWRNVSHSHLSVNVFRWFWSFFCLLNWFLRFLFTVFSSFIVLACGKQYHLWRHVIVLVSASRLFYVVLWCLVLCELLSHVWYAIVFPGPLPLATVLIEVSWAKMLDSAQKTSSCTFSHQKTQMEMGADEYNNKLERSGKASLSIVWAQVHFKNGLNSALTPDISCILEILEKSFFTYNW